MSSAELTVIVGIVAGAAAIALYLRDRSRAGTLVLRRDIWTVVFMAAGLSVFGLLLLASQSLARSVALLLLFAGAVIYLTSKSRTRPSRLAGFGLLVAMAVALAAWLLRQAT